MGTLNYTVGRYARTRGNGAASIASTEVRTSGAHTSNNSSATAIASLTLAAGEVFMCEADEPMWINFGATAAVGTGHYIGANIPRQFECDAPATVSVIDVA